MPQMARAVRHAKLRSSVQEIYSLVLATRMQAVKRNSQVILLVDLDNRRIVSWADRTPYNYKQDANEPTINSYGIPGSISFRALGNDANSAQSVAFDTYEGKKKLVDMIVFRGDGTLLQPENKSSQQPQAADPVHDEGATGVRGLQEELPRDLHFGQGGRRG